MKMPHPLHFRKKLSKKRQIETDMAEVAEVADSVSQHMIS